ncbi:MAG: hypothetical protein ACTHJ9_04485 [Rhodanobacter sp.]
MSQTMLLGPLGNLLPVPYPQSGMDWNTNKDSEVTELVSGGRHVYKRPTPYRSYKVTWKGGTPGLQNIFDLYNGVYGDGPFYLLDFNYTSGNRLPTRWASGYMLKAVAGPWCDSAVVSSTGALSGTAAYFSNTGRFPVTGVQQTVLATGQALHLRAWGAATGGGVLKVDTLSGSTWTSQPDVAPAASPSDVALPACDAVRLTLYVPSGGTLTVDHINLTEASTATRVPGTGVGAVQFSGTPSTQIVTKAYDRIGMAVELTEVES